MTRPQQLYYISLWAKVCAAHGWSAKDDSLRHAHVAIALGGAEKRFREFSNRDFDRVIAHFKELLGHEPDLHAAETGDRKRLVHAIGELISELGDAYCYPILKQRFHLVFREEIELLDLKTLKQLRATLNARAYAGRIPV